MKRTMILAVVVITLSVKLWAQQEYFIFIHTENQQPFYSRIGDKTLSSSSIGHVIVPNLKDSVYTIIIGFPKNQFLEQRFSIKINKKDAGYALKNLGEQEWVLFNLQSFQLIKAEPVETKKSSISYGDVKLTDAYSVLMAGVVNDSAILYTSIAKVEIPSEKVKISGVDTALQSSEIAKEGISSQPSIIENKPPGTESIKIAEKDTISVVEKPSERKEQVKWGVLQISSQKVKGGVQLVYMDRSEDTGIDTVSVFIPAEFDDTLVITNETKLKDSPTSSDLNTSSPKTVEDKTMPIQRDTIVITQPTNQLTIVNSDCVNFATETDMKKLRLKFRLYRSDDDKIMIARKVFKTKCVSTIQVQSLIEYFPSNEGKYKLFDAAYPFVSDSINFKELKQFLSDQYYIARFKAMIRE